MKKIDKGLLIIIMVVLFSSITIGYTLTRQKVYAEISVHPSEKYREKGFERPIVGQVTMQDFWDFLFLYITINHLGLELRFCLYVL